MTGVKSLSLLSVRGPGSFLLAMKTPGSLLHVCLTSFSRNTDLTGILSRNNFPRTSGVSLPEETLNRF